MVVTITRNGIISFIRSMWDEDYIDYEKMDEQSWMLLSQILHDEDIYDPPDYVKYDFECGEVDMDDWK